MKIELVQIVAIILLISLITYFIIRYVLLNKAYKQYVEQLKNLEILQKKFFDYLIKKYKLYKLLNSNNFEAHLIGIKDFIIKTDKDELFKLRLDVNDMEKLLDILELVEKMGKLQDVKNIKSINIFGNYIILIKNGLF